MIEPEDTVSVSELQDRLRPTLDHVRDTGRPVVVTQRGKAVGILLNIVEYRRLAQLADRAELEEDIKRGADALASGDLHDWEQVKQERLSWLQEP